MTTKINGATKMAAAAAAAVMALGLATAPAAFADDALGNIDTTKTGSLTIEKHKQTGTNGVTQGDGTQQSGIEGDLMPGVEFKAYKVTGFDMTNASSWDDLANLSAQGDRVMAGSRQVGTIPATADYSGTTNAQGQITWTGLPLGLYYVVEGGYTGEGQISHKAEPFFVSIPYPNANKDWNYDVYVYPKNSFGTTVKKVDSASLNTTYKVGDDIAWNIDQDVPTLAENQDMTKFGVVDRLDPNVTYKSVTVEALDSNGNPVAAPAFTEGVDYTVDDTVTRAGDSHKFVDISFTAAGLAKLKTDVSKVRFHVVTTVSTELTNPNVQNDVFPITNDYDPFHDDTTVPPIPSQDEPFYGDFQFKKVDDTANGGKPLQGAEFKIWRKALAECTVADVPSGAVTATSGADGMVKFNGLFIATAATGTDPATVNADFCLRETQAPAGFVTPDVNATQTVNIHAGRADNGTTGADVVNTKQTGPKLPMTGAAGTILLTSVAVVALGIALTLYVVNARRQQQH